MRIAVTAVCMAVFTICAATCFGQAVSMVTLGDSLTAGDGDDGVGGGYPARLLTMLQAENPTSTLSNVAVSGFTSLPEVAHIETSIVFEHRAKAALPDLTIPGH